MNYCTHLPGMVCDNCQKTPYQIGVFKYYDNRDETINTLRAELAASRGREEAKQLVIAQLERELKDAHSKLADVAAYSHCPFISE